ncbi:MAG: M48 family metallopeptidase [Alphaproteobacteria bacterium]|nr:M48 family metallopeptidase [Alphaproteobacteria bacterium]
MPSDAPTPETGAYFFDGQSPIKHPVTVRFGTNGLTVHRTDGAEPVVCPYALTRRIQPFSPSEHLALKPNDTSGARLVLTDPALIARFREFAPEIADPPLLNRSRVRRWTAIGATMAAAVFVFFVVIPAASSLFSALVPESTKRAVGAATIAQVFEPMGMCDAAPGRSVLDQLTGDLANWIGLEGDVEIHVARVPMVNAFALPGGHLILTGNLVEKAETSAELAAVIAHEIAHAKLGHPTEAYFRRGLISAVTDAIFGGGFGTGGMESVASLAITLGYSREAETQADELAIEALNDAGITTEGMANFFSRSAPNSQGALDLLNKIDWLSTHPSDTERRQRALEQGTGRNQALSPEDWRALKGICG